MVGTSVGAVNGAFVAADPDGAAERLAGLWQGESLRQAFSETVLGRAVRLARSGTHLHSIEPLRQLLAEMLPGKDFADLALPFHCVAASIEHATARWFTTGPVVPAVMASCAVPGLLPPVEIGGEHYFDGGLVDSIPVGRAVALGATTVYVLHVGRIERPLTVPRRPWEVGPGRVRDRPQAPVPRGDGRGPARRAGARAAVRRRPPPARTWRQFRYRDRTKVAASIERAYAASAAYLARLTGSLTRPPRSCRCFRPG